MPVGAQCFLKSPMRLRQHWSGTHSYPRTESTLRSPTGRNVTVAHDECADLAVLGVRGGHPSSGHVGWATARRVVCEATCPVRPPFWRPAWGRLRSPCSPSPPIRSPQLDGG